MSPLRRPFVPLAAALLAACQPPPAPPAVSADTAAGARTPASAVAPEPARAEVLPGLEVLLRDSLALVRGKRVGLLTNQSAVTRGGESAIDLLARAPEVNLVALYGPEHGLRGGVEGGTTIESGRDAATGLPVFSLYGKTQRPTAAMLRDVDVLLFDMQDIGARPYTFVWTMAMAMQAAAEQGIPFVVLDRPNPITAAVDGPLMSEAIRREKVGQPITGLYPVPLRHGMTTGEIARYVNAEYHVGADLHVVPAAGWRADEWFDATGLPWINPSPNIRSLDAALKYSGLVLFEATNLSVGRGTEAPFSYVGAPWLDAGAVVGAMTKYDLPGVRLDTARYVPDSPDPDAWVPFRGEPVRAVRLTVTDRDSYRPAFTALALLTEIRRQHPQDFKILNDGFTQMIGSRWAREAVERGEDPREIARRWETENRAWMEIRDRYRLYPRGGTLPAPAKPGR